MKKGSKSKLVISAIIVTLVVLSSVFLVYYFESTRITGKTSTSTIVGTQSPASASDPFITEYKLPSSGSLPNAIAIDSSGNVWSVIQNDSSLGVLSPSNGSLTEYRLPGMKAGNALTSWGIAVDNSRKIVWFTEETSNAIWAFNSTSKTFSKYELTTQAALPYQIAVDSKGNAWFTEFSGDKLGVVSTNGTLNEFQIPISPAEPTGIAIDSETGRVWFNLLATGSLDQFFVGSYFKGSFTFNDITREVDTPVGIAVGANGTLWLTQHGASLVSEFNPVTRYFRTISTSIPPVGASYPYFVYVDNSTGKIWFNEHYGNAISVFDPKTNSMTEYLIPSRVPVDGNISGALTMTLSPGGVPWFTELYSGKIGEINVSAPVGVSLKVSGGSVINLGNESSTQLELSVSDQGSSQVYLSASVGNFTGQFQFNFTEFAGSGNFSTGMTVTNAGSPPGVYFATISAETENVIVSQIIEINCSAS